MKVKERLKKFIKSQGLTISSFEKSINVSNGYVNSISKGIGGEILLTILEKSPNLNMNWLLTGEGEMLKEVDKGTSLSQTISGDNNTMSGNETYINSNNNSDKKTIKELKKRLSECEKKLEEKEKQISKLINVIEKLNSV